MGCSQIATLEDIKQIIETAHKTDPATAFDGGNVVGSEVREKELELLQKAVDEKGYSGIVGEINEMAHVMFEKDCANLNAVDLTGLGQQGNNMKIYDTISPRGVFSCKAHEAGKNGQVNTQSYLTDLGTARLNSGSVSKMDSAAQCLLAVAQSGQVGAPPELVAAKNPENVKAYLRANSKLVIPCDHVRAVRTALAEQVVDLPGIYGYDSKVHGTPQEFAEDVIQSSGISSANLGIARQDIFAERQSK